MCLMALKHLEASYVAQVVSEVKALSLPVSNLQISEWYLW